MPKREM